MALVHEAVFQLIFHVKHCYFFFIFIVLNRPQSFDDVRKSLEQIVVSKMSEAASENRYTGAQALTLRPLDALGNAVVSAHSLAAYASTLDIVTLRKLTAHVVADTGFWLARMFR